MQLKKWYDILISEHDTLLRALDVLKRELNKVVNNKHQTRLLYCLIDFLITFGNELHNRKEDEILFPVMLKYKEVDLHQINIDRIEHETGKDTLLSLFDEIGELKKRTPTYRKVYKQKGNDYIKYKFDHIWKENDIIFNLGREVISDEENAQIVKGFGIVDQSIQNGKYTMKSLSMLENLELGQCPEFKSRMMLLLS